MCSFRPILGVVEDLVQWHAEDPRDLERHLQGRGLAALFDRNHRRRVTPAKAGMSGEAVEAAREALSFFDRKGVVPAVARPKRSSPSAGRLNSIMSLPLQSDTLIRRWLAANAMDGGANYRTSGLKTQQASLLS
jgi:hypothetical protein